ncbi:hypothetical protein MBLNU230_g0431t1 [Neophaeotheca triangularis]
MGLKQEQPSGNPEDQTATTTTDPKPRPQLPPEALELATKLFDHARQGQTPELSAYLSAGIPPNLTNHKGDTLVMLAAYHGHADTVQMLIDQGADLDVLNDRGQSPVAGAVFKGFGEVVRVMAAAGADLAAGQPNAVECARMFNRGDMLRLFRVEE